MEAKLLGFNLTKINVEKNQDYQGEVQLKSNIDITSIEKHESEINTLIINIILQRCTLRALQLEEELALPFHIQLPQAKLQAPKESK